VITIVPICCQVLHNPSSTNVVAISASQATLKKQGISIFYSRLACPNRTKKSLLNRSALGESNYRIS
jgi:hypothetical protein